MNITIFHQNTKISLIDDINLVATYSNISFYGLDDLEYFDIFALTANDEASHIVIYFENAAALLDRIKASFTVYQAAGGIVYNAKQEVLLINRLGKWDLPKGKLEKNEQIEQCALREIEEETGVGKLLLIDFCCNTYHTYIQNNEYILKETFWYFVKTNETENKAIPQLEEGITEVKWVPEAELMQYATDTYQNIVSVMEQYLLFRKI